MDTVLGLAWAFLAQASLGAGNVLMKKGIAWLGWPGPKNRAYFRDLIYWLAGFLVMNASGLFTALAVRTVSPQLVAAFAGAGILVMILLARFLLKEPLFATDLPAALLIAAALTLLGLSTEPAGQADWLKPGLLFHLFALGTPLLLLTAARLRPRHAALFYALCAGSSAGLLALILKLLVTRHAYRLAEYPASPYLYLYIFFALLALVALQAALKRAALMLVGPAQYAALVLLPPLWARLAGELLPGWQWPLYPAVALGAWIILRRR